MEICMDKPTTKFQENRGKNVPTKLAYFKMKEFLMYFNVIFVYRYTVYFLKNNKF